MFSIFRDFDQLTAVEDQLVGMLQSSQETFALGTAAVFGLQDIEEAGDQLEKVDKEMNKTIRAIRRELLVHGTVRGTDVDHGLMLTYMSIAKDIERIGDYCKNIWNLAQMGVTFAGADDFEDLTGYREGVARLLREALAAFADQDAQVVHDLIPAIKEDLAEYDRRLREIVKSDSPAGHAVPRALFYRYLKRISAHLANTLSSVVMPVDRIDFYKPAKAAIEPEEDLEELDD